MGIYQVYAPKLQLNPFLTAENGDLRNLVYSHFIVKQQTSMQSKAELGEQNHLHSNRLLFSK